jgi:hypothetical protein
MTFDFYNNFHLGDCLLQLFFMRKCAGPRTGDRFILYCHNQYHKQLQEMIEDTNNVALKPFNEKPAHAFNSWIAADEIWQHRIGKHGHDHLDFLLEWFSLMAQKTGIGESPFKCKADLLFDYPALLKPTPLAGKEFDFLVVNAPALSGQFNFDHREMDDLIEKIAARHRVVVTTPTRVPGVECTMNHGISVTGIGNISINCPYQVIVSTGPSWPTFNTFGAKNVKLRVVLLSQTRLNHAGFTPADGIPDAVSELSKAGLI